MKKRILLPLILISAVTMLLCACTGTPSTATLDKTELTLGVESRETLTVVWENDAPTNVEYRWESSDEAILTVEADGETATVIAVAVGTATVTVYNGNNELATCNVTVVESLITVTVPEGKLVLRRGTEVTVRAKGLTELTGEYTWESSDTSIGTVEYQGEIARVTAVGRGECTIFVRNGIHSASFTLIVGLT